MKNIGFMFKTVFRFKCTLKSVHINGISLYLKKLKRISKKSKVNISHKFS